MLQCVDMTVTSNVDATTALQLSSGSSVSLNSEKGGDNVVVDNASKADEWLLFWESLCYKIQG